MAEALQWVSRITTVGLMMVLPIIGGRWLDERRHTQHWSIVGLVCGVGVGLWQLWQIAAGGKHKTRPSSSRIDSEPPDGSEAER